MNKKHARDNDSDNEDQKSPKKRKLDNDHQDTTSTVETSTQNKPPMKKKFRPPRPANPPKVYANELEHIQDLIQQQKIKREQLWKEKEERERKSNILKEKAFEDLDDMIIKWREVAQEAIRDLHKKVNSSRDTPIHQILAHFHIDEKLIQYDRESEEFY